MIDMPLVLLLLLITILLVCGASSSLCGAVLLREARMHWDAQRDWTMRRQGKIAIAVGLPAFAFGLALLVLLSRIFVPR